MGHLHSLSAVRGGEEDGPRSPSPRPIAQPAIGTDRSCAAGTNRAAKPPSNPRLGVSFAPLLSPHASRLLSLILGIPLLVYLVSHSIAPSPPRLTPVPALRRNIIGLPVPAN